MAAEKEIGKGTRRNPDTADNSRREKSRSILIRRARSSDSAALNGLYRQLHLGDYDSFGLTLSRMRRALEVVARNPNQSLLVAAHHREVIGSLHVLIFRHLGHGLSPTAIVENVVVHDAWRSRGVGERLIEAAIALARKHKCYKLSLTSNVTRHRAHRFYERLGWRRTHHGYTFPID
jgi:GNAT superfamily N-acetyltransferase